MGLFEKKQALSGGRTKGKPEKTPSPPVKEEKKDTSIFGGKPYIERGSFEYQLKNPKLYQTTGLGEKERSELGKKLFGSYRGIEPKHLKEVNDQLELGKLGKYKDLSQGEREKAKRLIKGISGK